MAKKVRPKAMTDTDLRHLLQGSTKSRVASDLVWTVEGRQEGRVEVVASVRTVSGAYARLVFPLQRPWAVALSYIGNDVCIRRVCANNRHRENVWGKCHMHTYIPSTGKEVTVPLSGFPMSKLHAEAAQVPFRDMFYAFFDLAGIDASGLQWTDPPQVTGGAR